MACMRTLLLAAGSALVLVCAALAQSDNSPATPELTKAEKEALATKAYFALRENCWGCHGEPGKRAYGETVPLDWILDYDQLIKTKTVVPGSAKESRLIYITAVEGKMPRRFDDKGRPSIEAELPEDAAEILIDWIKAGAPRWPAPEYTHEWVAVADAPEEGRIFSTHQGLVLAGEPGAYKLEKDAWQKLELAWPAAVVGTVVSDAGTYLLTHAHETFALQHWVAGGMKEVALPELKPGAQLVLVQSSKLELIAAVNGDNSPQRDLERWMLENGGWRMVSSFAEPDQFVLSGYGRRGDGTLVALAHTRTGFPVIAMLQLTDAGWETLSKIGAVGTPGLATMNEQGEALAWLGGQWWQFGKGEKGWQEVKVFATKTHAPVWDPVAKHWYLPGNRLHKLTPWRKPKD